MALFDSNAEQPITLKNQRILNNNSRDSHKPNLDKTGGAEASAKSDLSKTPLVLLFLIF